VDLVPSQDYKKAFDGNKGPNTGGMGNIAPPPWLTDRLTTKIKEKIVSRIIDALAQESILYSGVLFLGIMVVKDEPYVLEINVRFGDPEAQVVLPLLKTDFLNMINQICEGNIKKVKVEYSNQTATCIVLASLGYPDKYQTKKEIRGLEDVQGIPNVFVFHAGTAYENGKIVSNGGRVLNIVGLGNTIDESRKVALNAANKISFDGMFFRKDIGR
jgi:phosphoribosylamine--glycine ligase